MTDLSSRERLAKEYDAMFGEGSFKEDTSDNEITVYDAIDKNYGKDELLDHMLDDWLEADLQEEMEEV